jgi:hypothetical protein
VSRTLIQWGGLRQLQELLNWRFAEIGGRIGPVNAAFPEFLGEFKKEATGFAALAIGPAETGWFWL